MAPHERVNVKAILADPALRRKLMVQTIQTIQAREGIETTKEQAERAYYVVTESERTTFFDLARFRKGEKGDRRHRIFLEAMAGNGAYRVRFDVPRRDFRTIETSPLAYRLGIVSHIFREASTLDPGWGSAKQGLATAADRRFVRQRWEVPANQIGESFDWIPFAKGGDFCRFYSDVSLVVHWTTDSIEEIKKSGVIRNPTYYFKPALTWPRRTQRGFNLRIMPRGCVFADKGPVIFPARERDNWFLLGLANSSPAEYLLKELMSFGSWEVGVIKRLPVPHPDAHQHERVATIAREIHDAKAAWDLCNETSTRFERPWLVYNLAQVNIADRLERVSRHEATEEARIQSLYRELNDVVYGYYGIPDDTRAIIEETLAERPPEVIWPQMERRTADQKRMEHVWRLLSYTVKRVVEADEDGVVPFAPLSGEASLLDRVQEELAALFSEQDVNQVEVEIANQLKRRVNGYRPAASIGEWLENVYFDYHAALYKKRPIVWHIASSQGTKRFAFGALCHYHRFDANRMAKLRAGYLRDAIETLRREAALAGREGRTNEHIEFQGQLEEAQALDGRLQAVQEGHHEGPEGGDRDYRLLTPWKSADERPTGWNPDIDDGVKINIAPLQKAGVLRSSKVV